MLGRPASWSVLLKSSRLAHKRILQSAFGLDLDPRDTKTRERAGTDMSLYHRHLYMDIINALPLQWYHLFDVQSIFPRYMLSLGPSMPGPGPP